MEISTILGLIIGFAMMVGCLMVGEAEVSLKEFIDPPAIMMVGGGAIAVLLVGFPLKHIVGLWRVLKKPFFCRPEQAGELIDEIVMLAEAARKDGLLSLENKAKDVEDPFVARGIQLCVDGTRPEVVEEVLRSEIGAMGERHRHYRKTLDLMGRCGPAFGMIATLLGLILMLGNLDNPDTIGPSMACALIGTLYGAVMANLVCIPLSEKLAFMSEEERLIKEVIVRGVLAIQAGDNPRIVRQKLEAFVPPKLRQASQESM
jgi:chemotaxis protein MotA